MLSQRSCDRMLSFFCLFYYRFLLRARDMDNDFAALQYGRQGKS